MAEVWSARRSASSSLNADKFVAIKVLAPHLATKQQYRDMFLAEARLSMLLSHSNIVQVFDAVEAGDDCYMVMELIEGMTLSQLERGLGRQGKKLPTGVAAYVIGELLRALAYAHEVTTPAGSTIVHRDVSPQNVMVTTSGEVKLMDFGIARFATEETQGAFVKGKLQYMPPEQLKKETRKPTIDLFAVGGILHELLDGKPFRAKIEETRLLGMVLEGEVPELSVDLDEVPTELDVLRMWLLEAEEDHRIQTAKEALEQLYQWSDYRNAAIGLEKLVQEFVEPASAYAIPKEIVEEGSFSGVPVPAELDGGAAASNSELRSRDPEAATSTRVDEGHDTPDSAPELISASDIELEDDDEPQWRPAWLMPALAAAGVFVLGGVLVSIFGGSRGQDEDEGGRGVAAAEVDDEGAKATSEKIAADEAPPEDDEGAAEDGEAKAETGETGEVEAEAGTGGETGALAAAGTETGAGEEAEADATAGDDEKKRRRKPAADRPRVDVDFVANEFFFVYVKVGSRVLTLEPRKRVTLPVGSHTVYLRQSKDAKWTRAGRIRIDEDHSYRVEMRKPSGLRLVKK